MKPTVSLWERQSFLTCDVAIIGAGITGLSAAASLKERHPELNVTVLESGLLPTGASTKNAGFACFGSVSELWGDLKALGEDGMVALVEKRIRGLEKTISRLGGATLDFQRKGGYELLFEAEDPALMQIERINELLYPLFKKNVFGRADEKIASFGLQGVSAMIQNDMEGQLDTGKLMRALWQYCSKLGILIYTGAHVTNVDAMGGHVQIHCEKGVFRADRVGICTNAFSMPLIKTPIDLAPGRGMVMSIVPERPTRISGTFHYEAGYFYFRDYRGKILIGGGRNLDKTGEATTELGINPAIRKRLLEDVRHMILPDQKFEVEMEWAGIMAFGADKMPIVQQLEEGVVAGIRLGGMGVAMGSRVGDEVTELIMMQ